MKNKKLFWYETPTGSTIIIGLRLSGHEVVRNITSLYIIRQYYISFKYGPYINAIFAPIFY